MGSENAHGYALNAENGFGFDFFFSSTGKVAINFSVTFY
jgi:hypothetical protein